MAKPVILFGPLPPPHGGVSVFLNSLRSHLRESEVRLWALYGDHQEDPQVTYLNHRRLGVVPALLKEGRTARIVDLTHFHLEYPNPILLPIWLGAKLMLGFEWFKYVLDGSLPERFEKFNKKQRVLFRLAIRSIDQFIVVSDELGRWLKNTIKIKQPITVVPCLLNTPPTNLNPDVPADAHGVLSQFLKYPKRVCSSGVFIESYGFQHVIEAVQQLRDELKEDIGLLLLDGEFAADEAYRERALESREWISVLRNVPNSEVYPILKCCDVFVRGFGLESYGISRVEALWSRVPVIATRAGETRGMLTYDFGDIAELHRLLKQVLFNASSPDTAVWAATYRHEADKNLQTLKETFGLIGNTEGMSVDSLVGAGANLRT